ncbi:hypothetical protein [Tardiphaga sp. 768_D3_N2_1]|uniref:hypothetical protein n=1 Tax=Tardiphaga sp. 768_D3_N2_1 TaxID=3240783 RepID=UPI003F8C448F
MFKKLGLFFAGRWTPVLAVPCSAVLMLISDLLSARMSLFVLSLSAVPIAAMFYWVRRKHRLSYGITEMMMAIVGLYALMLAIVFKDAPADGYLSIISTRTISFIAAVYVMVRAFDNIGEGLPARFTRVWDVVFPKEKQDVGTQ